MCWLGAPQRNEWCLVAEVVSVLLALCGRVASSRYCCYCCCDFKDSKVSEERQDGQWRSEAKDHNDILVAHRACIDRMRRTLERTVSRTKREQLSVYNAMFEALPGRFVDVCASWRLGLGRLFPATARLGDLCFAVRCGHCVGDLELSIGLALPGRELMKWQLASSLLGSYLVRHSRRNDVARIFELTHNGASCRRSA